MKFIKGLGKFLSIIISILISLITICLIIYLSLDRFLSTSNLKETINTKNILNIKYNNTNIKEETIKVFEEFNIKHEDAKKIVESDEFENLLDDYINKIIDYYFKKDKFPELDTNKLNIILDLAFSKNNKLIEIQKELIKNNIINEKEEFEKTLPTIKQILEDEFIRDIINIYNNISIFYFIGAIMILMFIIFICTYSLYKPFKYVGISLIISSLFFMISYLFKSYIIKLYITSSLEFIVNNLFKQLLISSFIIFIIGILLLTIYLIINKIKQKKEVV